MAEQKQSYTYQLVVAGEAAALWRQHRFNPWQGNRPLNERRAARIAAHGAAGNDFGPTPVIIGTLVRRNERAAEFVIDGQHRLHAATLLAPADAQRIRLCICRVTCGSEDELRALFITVNCGTPVPQTYWDRDIAAFKDALFAGIRQRWGDVIKPGVRANRPQVSHDKLVAAIEDRSRIHLAAASRILSVDRALAEIGAMNDQARELLPAQPAARLATAIRLWKCASPAMLDKADSLAFPLGLDAGWPETFAARLRADWVAQDGDDEPMGDD
jgi:hypothetical protein